jgi:hypothetical protein
MWEEITDVSAAKKLLLSEHLSLQFHAEIFNLLNRTNFNTRRLQKAKQLWANLYLMD